MRKIDRKRVEHALLLLCEGYKEGAVCAALDIGHRTIWEVVAGNSRPDVERPLLMQEYNNYFPNMTFRGFLKLKGIETKHGIIDDYTGEMIAAELLPKLKKACRYCAFYEKITGEYGDCMQLDPRQYKEQTVQGTDDPCKKWKPDERVRMREWR